MKEQNSTIIASTINHYSTSLKPGSLNSSANTFSTSSVQIQGNSETCSAVNSGNFPQDRSESSRRCQVERRLNKSSSLPKVVNHHSTGDTLVFGSTHSNIDSGFLHNLSSCGEDRIGFSKDHKVLWDCETNNLIEHTRNVKSIFENESQSNCICTSVFTNIKACNCSESDGKEDTEIVQVKMESKNEISSVQTEGMLSTEVASLRNKRTHESSLLNTKENSCRILFEEGSDGDLAQPYEKVTEKVNDNLIGRQNEDADKKREIRQQKVREFITLCIVVQIAFEYILPLNF